IVEMLEPTLVGEDLPVGAGPVDPGALVLENDLCAAGARVDLRQRARRLPVTLAATGGLLVDPGDRALVGQHDRELARLERGREVILRGPVADRGEVGASRPTDRVDLEPRQLRL